MIEKIFACRCHFTELKHDVLQMTHEEWLAFLDKTENCTCEPGDALLCPSCREYNRKKYGDTIPFRGE